MGKIAEIQKDVQLLAVENSRQAMGTLPFGVQYYRAPTPLPEDWQKDVNNISEAGYNLLQLRPQWRTHERIRGKYVWDDIDRLVELADKKSVKFIIKPMLECAPDWVYTELEGYRIGLDERKIAPRAIGAFYVGGWLPCFDNPQVVEEASEFVRQLAQRYCDCEGLYLWNAWNEPRSRPLGECCCEHSLRAYRSYLKREYLDIENLNEKFGKSWTSFDTVLQPGDYRDYVELWLWRQWAADAVSRRVKFVYDAIREVDAERTIMAHVGCSIIQQDVACDTSDDIKNAAMVDHYGCSMPVLNLPERLHDQATGAMVSDWMRSVDPAWWCHELYPKWQNWEAKTDPQWLKRLIWTVIGAGARGVMFWQYRSERVGNEYNGHGLRDVAGDVTSLSEVADEIAQQLGKQPELVQCQARPADVGILYSFGNDLLNRITEMSNELSEEKIKFDYTYKETIQGAYLGMWMNDIRADWIDVRRIKNIHSKKCVIVNAMEMCGDAIFAELDKYVNNGGTLIVEYPFACRGDNTWLLPERPVQKVQDFLGVSEGFRIDVDEDEMILQNGRKIPVRKSRVELDVHDAEILARWDNSSPAITMRNIGVGKVVCIGGSVSNWSRNAEVELIAEVWQNLIDAIGLKDSAKSLVTGGWAGLETRILTGPDAEYFIALNHVDESGKITLPNEFDSSERQMILGGNLNGDEIELEPGDVICCKRLKE